MPHVSTPVAVPLSSRIGPPPFVLLITPVNALSEVTFSGTVDPPDEESVVAPVKNVVSAKARLIVIPDGPLYSLPFEMIRPRTGQRLLASKVVTYAPSGTVLTLLSEKNGPAVAVPGSRRRVRRIRPVPASRSWTAWSPRPRRHPCRPPG